MYLHKRKHMSSAWNNPSKGMRGMKEKSIEWFLTTPGEKTELSAVGIWSGSLLLCFSIMHLIKSVHFLFFLIRPLAILISGEYTVLRGFHVDRVILFIDMVPFLHWALVSDDYPAMKQQERSRRGPAAGAFWSPTQPAELEDMNHLSCALSAFSKFATLKVACLKVKRKSTFSCFLSNCALESIRASLQGWASGDIGRDVL